MSEPAAPQSTRLVFGYERDPGDDFAWLRVEIRTKRFAGEGGFWVQWQNLVELAEELTRYPITEQNPVRATWGYGESKTDKDPVTIVGFEVRPADPRGNLRVSLQLRDDETDQCLRASFLSNYPQLEIFAADLAQLASERRMEAVLEGAE